MGDAPLMTIDLMYIEEPAVDLSFCIVVKMPNYNTNFWSKILNYFLCLNAEISLPPAVSLSYKTSY